MFISWTQAALLGLVSCFAGINTSPLGTTIGNYALSRPIIASLFVGLIFNDMPGVIMMAVPVQLIFIAMITPGGAMLADLRSVSYIGLPLAYMLCIHWGITPGSDVSLELAGPVCAIIGVLFVFQYKFTSSLNEIWQKKGWAEINDNGNLNILNFTQTLMPFLSHLIASFIPVFAVTMLGGYLISALPMISLANPVVKAVLTIGMVLPVVGVGIVLNAAAQKKYEVLLFGTGFVFGAYFRLSIMASLLIASAIALLDFKLNEPKIVAEEKARKEDEGI
ncbi:MAG: PTS sugar transporter subunit IIC [Erysipelotrichia bacterium]|nr:PTS sugar transporter subunit IIC [Erysipelotrichia bacterium]